MKDVLLTVLAAICLTISSTDLLAEHKESDEDKHHYIGEHQGWLGSSDYWKGRIPPPPGSNIHPLPTTMIPPYGYSSVQVYDPVCKCFMIVLVKN